MARRRRTTRKKMRRGYKHCILSALAKTKVRSPAQARKAFTRAAKKCRKLYGAAPRKGRKRGRKKGRKRSRNGRRLHWRERRESFAQPLGAFPAAAMWQFED